MKTQKQKNNKRKEPRLFTLIDGAFKLNNNRQGCLLFTNINHVGCGVSLTRTVSPGTRISFNIRFPGTPVQAKGKVIWSKKRSIKALYNVDAGIELEEINSLDKQRIMATSYTKA
ncbi:MAG: PilZ domain-containing protein [Candidatus Omnitrophica bacterium]|nr:PilZ domain-containing protein [Candidatus Omnitrophota bacterium]